MPLVDGGVREAHEFRARFRKATDSKGRLLVRQFAALVLFRGLDVRTIWGVQLPACLRHA